jgi:hypothetical protein
MQRHDPLAARVVDGPRAIAATGGNLAAKRILQGTAFKRRIDAGLGDGAGEISGKGPNDRWIGSGMADELIQNMIAEGMARADKVSSAPRCPLLSLPGWAGRCPGQRHDQGPLSY